MASNKSIWNKIPATILPKDDKRDPAFVMLPGDLTGDMWHCAAATILAHKKPDPLIPKPYPITVVGVVSWTVVKNGNKDVIKPHRSIFSGSSTFEYFRSVGIPVLLARISNADRDSLQDSMMALEQSYIEHIAEVYAADPKASFENTWQRTKPAPPSQNLEETAKFPNDSVWPKPVPKTSGDVFPEPTYIWTKPDQSTSKPCIPLMTSTTIAMQFLTPPETRQERIAALHTGLTVGMDMKADPKAVWKTKADVLLKDLKSLIKTTYKHDDKHGKSIVLFNYREGDVNRQHDSSEELLAHVRSVAEAENANHKVIPIMVGPSDEDLRKMKNMKNFLNLYADTSGKPVKQDKRTIAEFWRLVAIDDELRNSVRGLIGGRSGSMDIAAFMGVNTCSWDEPDLVTNKDEPPVAYQLETEKKLRDQEYGRWLNQQTQYLRLYNQRAIMSVINLDANTLQRNESLKARKHIYTRLSEDQLKAWIKMDYGAAEASHVSAALDFNNPNVHEVVERASVQMERHTGMDIWAVNLRSSSGAVPKLAEPKL